MPIKEGKARLWFGTKAEAVDFIWICFVDLLNMLLL